MEKLFPVLSPLRNRIARSIGPVGGTATTWRAVTSINSGNRKGSVAFGTRNGEVSTTTANKTASFKTLGLDESVQDEAIFMGKGFEDVRAMAQANLLSAVMIDEERQILGGQTSFSLGTPGSATLTTSTSGGSIPAAASNSVKVVALTLFGDNFGSVSGGVSGVNHSAVSTGAPITTTGATSTISASTPIVNGALAYAWFAGAVGAERLEAITRINSVKITALTGAGELVTAITGDNSADVNDYDGILAQIFVPGSGAFIKTLATGTPGIGTALTADGSGGVVEIDDMLKSLWDNSRIGPTLLLVNSQEASNINKKVIAGGASPIYRINVDPSGVADLQAGSRVGSYLNKYTNSVIPLMIHPYLSAGTLVALSETLPYPNNNVPNVLEVETMQEYTSYDWARTQRKYEFGIYATEVLKFYFPAGAGIITNIANG